MSGALGWARIVRTSTVRRYQAIVEESGSPNGRAGQMCATSTRAAPSGSCASATYQGHNRPIPDNHDESESASSDAPSKVCCGRPRSTKSDTPPHGAGCYKSWQQLQCMIDRGVSRWHIVLERGG